jgi:membrane-associated phospholipid phosphatase
MPDTRLITYRRSLGVLIGVCAAIFLALGVWVWRDTRATPLDASVTAWLDAHFDTRPLLTKLILLPTEIWLNVGILVVLALWRIWKGDRTQAFFVIASPILASTIGDVIAKPIINRRYGGWWAYPSGHTTVMVTTFLVAFLVLRPCLTQLWRTLLLLLLTILAIIGASGLVVHDYHYPTDTVGATAMTIALVLSLALWLTARQHRATTRPDETPRVGTSSGTRP